MHADVRIIAAGFGGSDEQQQGVFTSLLVRVFDECFTDALFLERLIDRQVRQVSAMRKISQRPTHAHE